MGDEVASEEQHLRAELRERFLRLISHLSAGKNCRIKLYENEAEHTCRVRGFDQVFKNVIVEQLSTNYPQPIERAVLRTSDIMYMHFDVDTLPN